MQKFFISQLEDKQRVDLVSDISVCHAITTFELYAILRMWKRGKSIDTVPDSITQYARF